MFAGNILDRACPSDADIQMNKKVELSSYACVMSQAALWDWEEYVKAIIIPQYQKPNWEYLFTYFSESIQKPDLVTWYLSYKRKEHVRLFKLDSGRNVWIRYEKEAEPVPEFPVDLPRGTTDYSWLLGEILTVDKNSFIIRFMDQRVKTDSHGVSSWKIYVDAFIKANIGCYGVPRPLPYDWAKVARNVSFELQH